MGGGGAGPDPKETNVVRAQRLTSTTNKQTHCCILTVT